MRMVKIAKILSLLLILTLAAGLCSTAIASEADELIKQQQLLEQQIKQKEQELNQKINQESKALRELRSINSTLKTTESKLKKTESNLQKTQQDLERLEKELLVSEEKLTNNTGLLSDRLNTMYSQGNVHFLEVLLSSTSFTDFLTRWDLMSRLAKMDMELIADVKDEIKVTEQKRNEVLVKKETLVSLLNDHDQQKKELTVASSRQDEIYKNLASEKKQIEAALEDLELESKKIEAELLRLDPNTKYLGSGAYTWPTPGYKRITSPYGMRRHPILKTNRMHTGVDIGAANKSTIVAVDHGVVAQVGWYGAYGRVVMIDHGRGIVSMYAHTSAALVNVGDPVVKGQAIAKVGSTGWSTGPHLHFEIRVNGKTQNPLNYIKK